MSNASFSYVLRLYSFSYRSNIILPGLHKGEYSQGQDQMESLPLYQFFIIRTFYFVSYLYYTCLIFFQKFLNIFFFLLCFLCVYWISSLSSQVFQLYEFFLFHPKHLLSVLSVIEPWCYCLISSVTGNPVHIESDQEYIEW